MGQRGIQKKATGDWVVRYQRSPSLAETVINFVEALPTIHGYRYKLLGWQKRLIRNLYKVDKQGKRVVRQAVCSMGRKGGKSSLASAVLVSYLCGPLAGRGQELYSVASDKEQSGLLFNIAEQIILQCPQLIDMVNIVRHQKKIETKRGSFYKALASDSGRLHGLNPTFCCYDELAQAKSRLLYDTINTAFGSRDESLLLVISTQNHDPSHIMSEVYDYAEKVSTGKVIDPTYYAQLYSAPQSDPIGHVKTWRKANPSLGSIRNLDELRRQYQQPKHLSLIHI